MCMMARKVRGENFGYIYPYIQVVDVSDIISAV